MPTWWPSWKEEQNNTGLNYCCLRRLILAVKLGQKHADLFVSLPSQVLLYCINMTCATIKSRRCDHSETKLEQLKLVQDPVSSKWFCPAEKRKVYPLPLTKLLEIHRKLTTQSKVIIGEPRIEERFPAMVNRWSLTCYTNIISYSCSVIASLQIITHRVVFCTWSDVEQVSLQTWL